MSPTEFSNYLKQRGIQQQMPTPIGQPPNHFGPIGSISPSRSISPNTFAAAMQDPKQLFFQSMQNMYPSFGGSPRGNGGFSDGFGGFNGIGNNGLGPAADLHLYTGVGNGGKMGGGGQQASAISPGQPGPVGGGGSQNGAGAGVVAQNGGDKLLDTYYSSNAGSYHHLLVAN